MHAALGNLAVLEITLLHREQAQIVTGHGPLLVELAHEEIGKRLMRLRLLDRRLGLRLLDVRVLLDAVLNVMLRPPRHIGLRMSLGMLWDMRLSMLRDVRLSHGLSRHRRLLMG